jgi:hypothetical protein
VKTDHTFWCALKGYRVKGYEIKTFGGQDFDMEES